MGYYASGSGDITVKQLSPDIKQQAILAFGEIYDVHFYKNSISLSYDFYDRYYDEAYDCLNEFAKHAPVTEGLIYFEGEDDAHWRFVYNKNSGEFDEEAGETFYGTGADHAELIGQIIDIFEDYLDSNMSILPTGTFDESAVIFEGRNYDAVSAKLRELIENWRIFK